MLSVRISSLATAQKIGGVMPLQWRGELDPQPPPAVTAAIAGSALGFCFTAGGRNFFARETGATPLTVTNRSGPAIVIRPPRLGLSPASLSALITQWEGIDDVFEKPFLQNIIAAQNRGEPEAQVDSAASAILLSA